MDTETEESSQNRIIITSQNENKWFKRQDLWSWIAGMIFMLCLAGAIFGVGHARGWYAPSGYYHNVSLSSQQRFWPEPFVEQPGIRGRSGPGRTSRWYYWKLPPDSVTSFTRLFTWICYSTHQVFVWSVIYAAQVNKAQSLGDAKYSTDMSKYNWAAFGANIFFHLLHFLQTHTTYDALAQDVHVTSSQGSVIMLIVYVVLLEYRDRGLLFGWPSIKDNHKFSKIMRMSYGPMYVVRKFHGYAFAWAAIYTFWYHPMENTIGHVMGFFHTWIILLQGSLMYTELHLNKWWRFMVETWVTVHASVIAYQTGAAGSPFWPMFCFGFSLLVCVTQIFGLPFWRKIPFACRFLPLLIYVGLALFVYGTVPDGQGRTFARMYEIFFIPLILLLLPLLCNGLILLCLKFESFCQRRHATITLNSDSMTTSNSINHSHISTVKRVVFTTAAFLVLVIFVAIGWAVEYFDTKGQLFVLMNLISAAYSVGIVLFVMFMKQAILVDIPSPTEPVQLHTGKSQNGTNEKPELTEF